MKASTNLLPKIVVGAAFLIILVFPIFRTSQYIQHVLVMTLMAATLASSWNIIGGYAGYISLGHAAFFGLGAYLVTLAHNQFDWHPFISSWLLGFVVLGVALFFGWVALRTHGTAFVVVTIAMVLIFRIVALNLQDITKGAQGLTQGRPGWGGVQWSPEFIKFPFLYIMLALLCVTLAASWWIRRSKFGLGLLAIREDQGKAEAVGINAMLYKVLAFGISAYFVAVAGGIYSYFMTFIEPRTTFDVFLSVTIVLYALLGGRGTLWGPVLGAFIMVPLDNWVIGTFGGTQIHLAVFGVILLLVMLFMPQGVLPMVGQLLKRVTGRGKTVEVVPAELTPAAEAGEA